MLQNGGDIVTDEEIIKRMICEYGLPEIQAKFILHEFRTFEKTCTDLDIVRNNQFVPKITAYSKAMQFA